LEALTLLMISAILAYFQKERGGPLQNQAVHLFSKPNFYIMGRLGEVVFSVNVGFLKAFSMRVLKHQSRHTQGVIQAFGCCSLALAQRFVPGLLNVFVFNESSRPSMYLVAVFSLYMGLMIPQCGPTKRLRLKGIQY
jgi:hypothetical protein